MAKPQEGLISLLVPYLPADAQRATLWHWLRRYWRYELRGAEVVIGRNHNKPFSKTQAVNDAARRANGDTFVILDADAYIDGSVIQRCSDRIHESERNGHPLWFVPYRSIYRLTPTATDRVLTSPPKNPLRFPTPPNPVDVESTLGSGFGHKFGALIQIMSRNAFETVGCMDPRFNKGWGGEDVAFLRAVDTLYGPHKTTDNDVLHLWHAKIGTDYKDRRWVGQDKPRGNDKLAMEYHQATNRPAQMRALVDAGCALNKPYHRWRK